MMTQTSLRSVIPTEPYPDPDRPGVYRVPVASRVRRIEALVDEASLPLVKGKRWNFSPGHGDGTGRSVVAPKAGSMARIVMGVADDPSVMVSHVNGDRLDCRCQNLFVRTRSEVAKARKPSPETVARLTPYPDPKRPGVWRVPLKSHLVRHEALIDEADLPIVQGRNWNWNPRTDGKIDGEVLLATTRARTPLSRIIMDADGVDDRVQYLNGDALDCRRANLIVRTCAEQVHTNGKMQSRGGQPCISRFKGVTWDKSREKWIVKICKDGVHRHIGRFGDELAAAEAYDEAARGLFGEHAYLNFPDGIDAWLEQQATELKTESAAPKREAA